MEPIAFEKVRVELTMNGASGDVAGMRDDEPMCMHTIVSVSSHARNSGSQNLFLSCTEGSPSGCGFSENAIAKLPLSAQRRTSSAHSCESHSGTIVNGMRRPLASPAHHSSIIQSLQA